MLRAGVSLALGLSTIMFYRLYQGAIDDYANFKSSVATQMEALRIENEAKLAAMGAVQRRTEDGWREALDALRKRGGIRVLPARCPGVVPAVPITTERLNEAPTEPRPDTEISVAECEGRVNNAVQDATHVVWLQHWIQQQHDVTK